MDKNIYIFPAIVTKFDEDDYNVKFPDFEEIITFGEDLEEAYLMAEDALKLCLFDLYEDGEKIPEAKKIENIKLESNQTLIIVKANLKEIIKEYDNKAVKKTLTIPSWLNKEAEKAHVNFSQLLQKSLKNHLDLND
ncbi:type II toxin-antitoxin system HicB family antitoxin [Orenia metallireducens]|nr:type II toxin-antitoxin system HicB family antitoxin [Orenia metallireducens]